MDLQAFVASNAPEGVEVAYAPSPALVYPEKVSYTLREIDIGNSLLRLEAYCADLDPLLAFACRTGGVIKPIDGGYLLTFQIGAKTLRVEKPQKVPA